MFSISNIENTIRAEFVRTESAVQSIVTRVVNDVEVGLADLQGAGNWIASHAPQIAGAVTGAVALATGVGAPISPALLAEVQAASTALQAFAAAHNAGQSTPASVVNGYVAYKQATGAISTAMAASIQAKASGALDAINTAAQGIAANVPAASGLAKAIAGTVANVAANGASN